MQNFIANHALAFISAHHQWVEGLLLGALLTHPGTLAVFLFNLFVKIPGVGSWIANNPEKATAWADEFDKAIDGAIAKYTKDSQTPAA